MKILMMFILSLLVSCGNSHLTDPEPDANSGASEGSPIISACLHPQAENYQPQSGLADAGACTFKACDNAGFAEHSLRDAYHAYILSYGGEILNDPSKCIHQKEDYSNKCENPRAYNFQLAEDCKFKACSDETFVDHYEYLSLVSLYGAAVEHDQSKCVTKKAYPGCMNETASNYNANANQEDKSCKFTLCLDSAFEEFDLAENQSVFSAASSYALANGLSVIDLVGENTCKTQKDYEVAGCTIEGAIGYSSEATIDNKSCRWNACLNPNYEEHDADLAAIIEAYKEEHGGALEDYHTNTCEVAKDVYGCTAPSANNTDAGATADDGSCKWSVCLDPLYEEYDSSFQVILDSYVSLHGENIDFYNSSSCTTLKPVLGCTIPGATGYSAEATQDNGSCRWETCLDSNYTEYDSDLASIISDYIAAHGGDQSTYHTSTCSVANPIYGCTQPTASNTDSNATHDDGTCMWNTCLDSNYVEYDALIEIIINGYAAVNGGVSADYFSSTCVTPVSVEGCTDEDAENYNPNASIDNGTCHWIACCNEGYSNSTTADEKLKYHNYAQEHGGDLMDYITLSCEGLPYGN